MLKQKIKILVVVIFICCLWLPPCIAVENVTNETDAQHLISEITTVPTITISPNSTQSVNLTEFSVSSPSPTLTSVVPNGTINNGTVNNGTVNGELELSPYLATNNSQSLNEQDNFNSSVVRPKMVDENGNLTPGEEKLSTALLLETNESSSLPAGDQQVSETGLLIKTVPARVNTTASNAVPEKISSGKLVYVYISTKPGYSTHIVDSLVADVTDRNEDNHLAVGWVDVTNLQSIAGLEGVQNIRQVIPPEVHMGSVTTEGDAIHKTANVRSTYGYKGAGMKIGIISDGVDHIADSKATGDLPSNVHVLSNTVGGDEGTAMLEIVYDMVPDAELYFHDCGSNKLAFIEAIAELKTNGCTVICDDIGWNDEPFFEDGIIALNVTTLLSSNRVIYVSSAGNDAQKHYQGAFYDNGAGYNDFSRGTATNKYLYVKLPAGSKVQIYLEWDDQFGHSGNDYNLYLTQSTYGDLGISENVQNGASDPIETISYTNTGSSTIEGTIDVKKYSGVTKTLELFIFPKTGASLYSNNLVASDSVFGHPAVPDAIAVAAVYQGTPSTIESFSSLGPVTIAYPSAASRSKPDISGVDGVSITGAGGFSNPFYGTSAAAPHVAAIVAQIWGAHPSLTPAQVRSALYSSAVNLGTGVKDTTFGYGRADALAMAGITAVPGSGVDSGSSDNGPAPFDFTSSVTRTETVNVGGGSAVTRAELTGTGLGKNLVITAMPRSKSDLPATMAAPPTTVYQYMSITSSTITGVVSQTTLDFSVPQSWLTEQGYTIGDIVMMRNVDSQWQTTSTQFVSQKSGNVFYRATTPGFSYFAIAYQMGGTNMGTGTPVPTPLAVAAASVTNAPSPRSVITTEKTQIVPPAPVTAPVVGLPLTTIVVGVSGAIVIIIGAVFVRRRWIRRQNPALFRKYD